MFILEALNDVHCWLDERGIHPEHLLPDNWIFKRGYFYHIKGWLTDGTNIVNIFIYKPMDERIIWEVLREYDWEFLRVYQGKSPRYSWVCPKKKLVIKDYV